MSRSKEYELAVKIAGEVEKSFYESTRLTKKELSKIAKEAAATNMAVSQSYGFSIDNMEKNLKDAKPFFSGLENAARTSFKAISAAGLAAGATIGAGLAGSVSAGSDFESAFAGVKKTVTATDQELAVLRNDIREMARDNMPTSAVELSAIAEAAGQLGIQTENIAEFTKTMADMKVTTDLASEEAAEDFAKFANITEMEQKKFSNLGSTVVALGNSMATTESATVGMGMRIAAAGKQVHLTEAEIMGYAAALSSVGIEEEVGGSAFSKLLANMQLAAETGKNLSDYAKVAGMTGDEFKKAFQQDASGAINEFLAGLQNTERNGKSAIAVLNDMGLTEVRLRDTLLRASNASDLFDTALVTANQAWEENVALANEAEQRYKTFESQQEIVKNKMTDIGISVYDDLKPGLEETMLLANEFIDSIAGKEDVIGDMIDSAVKSMPTMVREVKDTGKAVKEFAEPFLTVGGWLADNPGLITGTIAGIGTSLAAYKVASGVLSLASALGSLGPAGMAIMGLGGAAAVITGIGTAVKKSAAEAKKANLDKHFGDISLSLSEIQKTASFIVKNKDLDKIRESVAAMGELDGIADQISSAAEAMKKADWKVSIGMELTEEERESYRSQAEDFVASTQEYLTQRHYAVNMAVTTLLGDDLENSNLVTELTDFYSDKEAELAGLGEKLNNTINEAFEDGLLDIDEVKEISQLKEQIAHIQSAMAESDFEAGLDLIGMKYSGQQLDAESFQNLQAEIQSQIDTAMEAYDSAYATAMSENRMLLSEGEISQKEFNTSAEQLNKGYLQQKMDIQTKAVEFQVNTIKQAYGEEELSELIEKTKAETENQISETLENVVNGGGYVDLSLLSKNLVNAVDGEVDPSTQDAIGDFYELLIPAAEQMDILAKQYRDAGIEIPKALREGITDVGAMGTLSGSVDATWAVIGQAAEKEEYRDMLVNIADSGGYIPEQIADAITANQGVVTDSVNSLYKETYRAINETFGNNELEIPIHIKANAPYSNAYLQKQDDGNIWHKDGGIFTKPHRAWFAENGMEAAIPIDGSQNAIDLWLKTGELLGMEGLTDGGSLLSADMEEAAYNSVGETSMQIDNSRVINFYGNTPSKEELEEVLEDEDEKFAKMMERYLANGRRTRFY